MTGHTFKLINVIISQTTFEFILEFKTQWTVLNLVINEDIDR